jgi:hypothetical protein
LNWYLWECDGVCESIQDEGERAREREKCVVLARKKMHTCEMWYRPVNVIGKKYE